MFGAVLILHMTTIDIVHIIVVVVVVVVVVATRQRISICRWTVCFVHVGLCERVRKKAEERVSQWWRRSGKDALNSAK